MDIEGSEQEVPPHVIRDLQNQCMIFFEVHGGVGNTASQAGFQVTITRTRRRFFDGFSS
jgi:hypothetical protein